MGLGRHHLSLARLLVEKMPISIDSGGQGGEEGGSEDGNSPVEQVSLHMWSAWGLCLAFAMLCGESLVFLAL